jgi:peptide-methionine (R)-S-oxide reductase
MDEAEIKKKLTPLEYHVLREKGTEPPFSGEYTDFFDDGIYLCKVCGSKLFSSDTKFHSGCGWPAFETPVTKGSIILKEDFSHGMERIEVLSDILPWLKPMGF